jgi:hypothetical protein
MPQRYGILRLAPTINERLRQQKLLHHLYDAAILEADLEWSRRLKRLSPETQKRMSKRERSAKDNSITSAEAGLVQHLNSVPRVALIDELTSENLADMYEGWAHDPRVESFEKLRLLGWADGMRILHTAVGPSYEPPERVAGEPVCLTKFIANSMLEST